MKYLDPFEVNLSPSWPYTQSLNIFLLTAGLLKTLYVQAKLVHHSSTKILFFTSNYNFIEEATEEQIHGSW